MSKRTLTLLIALSMTASICSCGGDSSPNGTTTGTETETTEAPETTLSLGIPEEDNGGRTFTILVPSEKSYEFVTESNGEIINDAMYDRSRKVEEHFNIKFDYRYEPDNWDVRGTYNALISSTVLAGDPTYDLITGYIVCTLPEITGGYFIDLNQSELNFDNPWWLADHYGNLSINGKIFCAIGDANLSVYKDCAVSYFNKQLLEDFELENPYELVRSGEWTLDKLIEMSGVVTSDLDGDGSVKLEGDRIGCYMQRVPWRAFQTAFEIKVVDVDENNERYFPGLTERMADAFEKLMAFNKSDAGYFEGNAVDFNAFPAAFCEDRALFHFSYLYITEGELMRNMKSDFGIVPYPKYDTAQEKYYSQIGTSTNVMFIPKTASDVGLTCRVMEALSYYGMQDVVPAYYEIALRDKYTRDEDVPEMLGLIRDGMTMDFAFAFSTCFSPQTNSLMTPDNGDNLASTMASGMSKWGAALEKLGEIPE